MSIVVTVDVPLPLADHNRPCRCAGNLHIASGLPNAPPVTGT